LKVYYNEYKARKGLFKVKIVIDDGNIIKDIYITGDFFIYPEEVIWIIEDSLKGVKFEEETVSSIIRDVFAKEDAVLVGCTLDEFIKTIMEARPVE